MAEFVSPILGCVSQYGIDPIRARFRILRQLRDNIQELGTTAKELDDTIKDRRGEVEDAMKQQVGVKEAERAKHWFRQADEAVSEANGLTTEYEELQERRSGRACSSWSYLGSRYQLSKRALNLKKRVDKLCVEEPRLTVVASTSTPPPLYAVSMEGQIGRELLKNEIIQSVLDNRYLVVGLHGMGGIGKTTLLQHVYNHFSTTAEPKPFRYVIFTTVSATPNFVKLREQIAKGFGLDLKNCTGDDDVKEKLSRQTGKYLLVLDDMWEPPIDLKEICIPAPTKKNGCKILMASRLSKVIKKFVNQFVDVASLHSIPVDKLPPDEAWNLFVTKVGESLINSRPEIKSIAEEIVKKCDGLPLVITVVGSTMSTRQRESEWRDALREMKQLSKANLEDIEKKVFKLLTFSFEKLDPLEKSLFLYCCLFPEDTEIWKDQLYQFGIGEKAICDEMPTLRDMRDKVDVLVGNLKNSSMLEAADYDDDDVKMHDVLREFGLWIASPKIIAKEAGHEVLTSEWLKVSMVSLYSVESTPHPLSDDCPHLHTLMLNAKESANVNIPQAHFLERMPALKILHLDHFDGIKNFPLHLDHFVVNLRLLSLRGCDSLKELPREIGMLVQLVSLDLESCTSLRRLPAEMKGLKNLRHLNIKGTQTLKRIPCGVLSGLRRLEEIECRGSGLKLENDNILELYELRHLTLINGGIRVWQMKVVVSHLLEQFSKWPCRDFEFWECDISDSSVLLDFIQFPQGLSYNWLRFRSCKGLTRVPASDRIEEVVVDRCRDLKTLVVVVEEEEEIKVDEERNNNNNNNTIIAFQKLRWLELYELDGLETICSGRVPPQQQQSHGIFSNLKYITIERCHKLKVLFTSGVTPLLVRLEFLQVYDCSQLEYLLIEEDNDDMESIIINAFPELWEIRLFKLPELRAICCCTSNNTSNNQHPMDLDLMIKWPSLRRAEVYDCPKLLKLGTLPSFGATPLIEDRTYMIDFEKKREERRKREEEEQEDDDNLESMD